MVEAEKILHDLGELWVNLGEEEPLLRACSLTLIAVVEDDIAAADVSGTLAELMHEHPSRAIVIRVRESEDPLLEARVLAQCWMPFGKKQQICCEQIEITVSSGSLKDLRPVLLGVTVPDLPVVIWCREASMLTGEGFAMLAEVAGKVIADSKRAADPAAFLAALAAFRSQGKAVADLAWTRITRWRATIAQVFDNLSCRRPLDTVASLGLTHTSHQPTLSAQYLLRWMELCLERPMEFVWSCGLAELNWEIQRVELRGPDMHFEIFRHERNAVEINANGQVRRALFRNLSEADLLREELSLPGQDPAFEKVLRRL